MRPIALAALLPSALLGSVRANDQPLTVSLSERLEVRGPCAPCFQGDDRPQLYWAFMLNWVPADGCQTYNVYQSPPGSNDWYWIATTSLTERGVVGIELFCDHNCDPNDETPTLWDAIRLARTGLAGTRFQIQCNDTGQRGPETTVPPPATNCKYLLIPGISLPAGRCPCTQPDWSVCQFEKLRDDIDDAGVPGDNILIAGDPASIAAGYPIDGSQREKAAYLRQVLEQFAPDGECVNVIGYSEGGAVALELHNSYNSSESRVTRLAAVGSPFAGSSWADAAYWGALALPALSSCISHRQLFDLTTMGSRWLNALDRPLTPEDMQTYSGEVPAMGANGWSSDGVVANSSSTIDGVPNVNVQHDPGNLGNPFNWPHLLFHTQLLENRRLRERLVADITRPAYAPPGDPDTPGDLPLTYWSADAEVGPSLLVQPDPLLLPPGSQSSLGFDCGSNTAIIVQPLVSAEAVRLSLKDALGVEIATVDEPPHIIYAVPTAAGRWSLVAENTGTADAVVVPIVRQESAARLQVDLSEASVDLPADVIVTARFVGDGARAGSVSATHRAIPDGDPTELSFRDDGLDPDQIAEDGVFTARWFVSEVAGFYALAVRGDGSSASGERIGRAAVAFITADCRADFNHDGQLNLFDFLAFQTAFGNEDSTADLAPPFGVFHLFDFLAFQTALSNGCS